MKTCLCRDCVVFQRRPRAAAPLLPMTGANVGRVKWSPFGQDKFDKSSQFPSPQSVGLEILTEDMPCKIRKVHAFLGFSKFELDYEETKP